MIFYNITASMPVKPDWGSISGDLKAGTPISIGGKAANDDAAIGLVAGDTAHGAEYAVVVTAGVVDLNAASASYGSTISDDVVQALDNVTFIYGGKVYAVSGSSLPDYSQASDGDVLGISSGVPGWVTPSGVGDALVVTLTEVEGYMWQSDKTASEIVNAAKADKLVLVTCAIDGVAYCGAATVDYSGSSLNNVAAQDCRFVSGNGFGTDSSATIVDMVYAYGSWDVTYWTFGGDDGGGEGEIGF